MWHAPAIHIFILLGIVLWHSKACDYAAAEQTGTVVPASHVSLVVVVVIRFLSPCCFGYHHTAAGLGLGYCRRFLISQSRRIRMLYLGLVPVAVLNPVVLQDRLSHSSSSRRSVDQIYSGAGLIGDAGKEGHDKESQIDSSPPRGSAVTQEQTPMITAPFDT
ncbi:hypothetical protein GE09DRAFT_33993 [Coniochaeta sp. 2T2.1]|nr:hypothetical protein GE09DRAFT_33993 [Coniochaeta sp. 2T2.1]